MCNNIKNNNHRFEKNVLVILNKFRKYVFDFN